MRAAIILLDDTIFENGMSYVALSRVGTLEGVSLLAFDRASIFCDQLALEVRLWDI